MKISNTWLNLIKTSLILFWAVIALGILKEGASVPTEASEKRAYFFMFFFVVPFFTSVAIYYLNVLIKNIDFENTKIVIVKSRFFSSKTIEISVSKIKEIKMKSEGSTSLFFILNNEENIKIDLLGLKDSEGRLIEPPYNQYMPSHPTVKNAYKIAYNISKKYNIPSRVNI